MTSTQAKITKLTGLLDTSDLNLFERGFVESMQRYMHRYDVSMLSGRQVTVLEQIYSKHFSD